ncbi:MAG: hypothetical protein K9J17_14345 [Flavobacteriales bacterium]|nr:hypothetical protein [Flavobacteriales bacterium]
MRLLRLSYLSLVMLMSAFCYGQEGHPFMTDIELGRQYSDLRIGSIAQESEESMFFSTSRGLLKYDGSTWIRINTPSPVIKVYNHSVSDRIFVALKHGAMEVVLSDSGVYMVTPIAGISTDQPISHILGTDNEVFFIGESEIHRYNPLTNEAAERFPFAEKLISGAFLNEQQLFVLFYQEGLFQWDEKALKAIGNHVQLAENQLLFSFETANGTFLGFDSDRVYRFADGKFHVSSEELKKFLSDNILSDGTNINDSLMAFSTLAGGAVVVNIKTQQIKYRFDYSTGCKDNEIFCLGKDRDDGLWLAYEAGLSRVDISQPVKNFSGYPGLEGNLISSIVANGVLHIGTGNGVYVLKKASNKAEMERVMDDMLRKKQEAKEVQNSNFIPPESKPSSTETRESADLIQRFKENPAEVKEELSRKEIRDLKKELRRQRKNGQQNNVSDDLPEDPPVEEEPKGTTQETSGPDPMKGLIPNPSSGPAGSGMTAPPGSGNQQQNRPAVLNQSSAAKPATDQKAGKMLDSYLYRKVKGIDIKCRQLISLGNQVFAATNNGLYAITGENSKNLTPGMYINYATVSSDGKKLLLASLTGVFELAQDRAGNWVSKALNDSVQFAAYNLSQDAEGDVWAGTDNGAYRYSKDQTRFYPLPEIVNERVLVANVYGKIHFLLPSSLFLYIPSSDKIIPATLPEVPTSDRLEFILGNDGLIWIQSTNGWHVLNGEQYEPMLPYLELFEDIRHLSTDDKGNIYLIEKGTAVYSVMKSLTSEKRKFNIYFRQVVDANGQSFSLQEMKIKTDGDALIFNVSAPFYLKSQGTEYQYRIEGVRDNWSRWSSKTEIEPGIIPSGDYVLQVRARNILGEVSDIKTLEFSVPQRLFLRWYFLLLYVILLSLIILGIIKVRERSLKETQRILEEKVALRTAELESEKVKTEELLLNILPKDTANELQLNGKATARHYNQVSVLFTDFKGFTQFAENTKPEDLVNELHRYFVRFDEIIGKYYLEKIKTIGDAYMCAGGVPIRNNSNPISITLAALEIRDFMLQVAEEKRKSNEAILEIRIGMHTGPLTAGVVGLKKFAYDIWGDTVNTASRMESASEPGRINVSGTTYEMIKKYFECEFRGKQEVKGKGLVEMYFVNSIKAEFSENGDGRTPNSRLWELIS